MQSNYFFLSIIIPFYNRANLLIETIKSIQSNDDKFYEIILIDDGSSDNETKKIKNFIKNHKISYYKIKNSERGYARNYGASKAKGNYLNFFDSDDICYNNHVSDTLKFAKKNNFPKLFANSFILKKKNNSKIKIKYKYDINKIIFNNNIISCNSVIIEKQLFLKYKFCENINLSGSEDWDLWLRISIDNKFIGNTKITTELLDHDLRSTRKQEISKTILRLTTLERRINNKKIFNLSLTNYNKVLSEIQLFKSMVFSFKKNKKKITINLFLKSIKNNPFKLFSKRSILILKNYLFF